MSDFSFLSHGWIEVICGSMFSGKTEELLRRVRRATIARQKVQIFKPRMDDRYSAENVVSHDRRETRAYVVGTVEEMVAMIDADTQVVAIDEAQFFGPDIVHVCQALANRGVRVVVAGLDQDFRGRPFEPMPQLLAVAEFITKNHAICVCCGGPASRSVRISGGNETIQVGEADQYEARCRACADLPREQCPLQRRSSAIPVDVA